MEVYPASSYTCQRYRPCWKCGPLVYTAVIQFDTGIRTPVVGETIASATANGVVSEFRVTGGSFAGGDATGTIVVTSPTGYDDLYEKCFLDNETIGGTGGCYVTVNRDGALKRTGRIYPEAEMAYVDGRWWCQYHYDAHFPITALDQEVIDVTGDDEMRSAKI